MCTRMCKGQGLHAQHSCLREASTEPMSGNLQTWHPYGRMADFPLAPTTPAGARGMKRCHVNCLSLCDGRHARARPPPVADSL